MQKNAGLRESITTYEFISDAMRIMAGYDVVFECEGTRRYIQLKVKDDSASTSSWEISNAIIEDEEGYLVVFYTEFCDSHNWDLTYRAWDSTKLPKTSTTPSKTMINQGHLLVGKSMWRLMNILFENIL